MAVRAVVMATLAIGLFGCDSANVSRAGSAITPLPSPGAGSPLPETSPPSVATLDRPFRCPPMFTNNGSTYLPAIRPGLAASIVPGTPARAIVCRYAGVPTDGGLVQSATLTDTAALVAVLNAATQIPYGASEACKDGTGQLDLLLFRYATGPPVGVTVELDGCSVESNGVRLAYADTAQQQVLADVAGSPSPTP